MKNTPLIRFAVLAGLAVSGSAIADSTMVPAADWGSMISVPSSSAVLNELIYEFTVTPDQPLTISSTFTASGYQPGPYQPGFVSPGWFYVRQICSPDCGADGNVVFDMGKRYGWDFQSSDTMILIGDVGRGTEVGDYVPGATYTTTMTWNRAESTIDITVAGSGGSFSRTVASSGRTITGLVFRGPNYDQMGASAFGQVSVMTQPIPEPQVYALLLAGLGLIGVIARRRRA